MSALRLSVCNGCAKRFWHVTSVSCQFYLLTSQPFANLVTWLYLFLLEKLKHFERLAAFPWQN